MSDANFNILVFEDDAAHCEHLKKILNTPGCKLTFEDTLYQATQRFKSQPFDLSIISLTVEEDEEAEELAWWLVENYPRRSVILTGNEILPEQEDLLSYKSVLGFFPSPLNPDALTKVLKTDGRGLKGQVYRMQIPDLLQALRWSQDAVILVFMDEVLRQEGWLYLQKGEIVHAEIYQRQLASPNKPLVSEGTAAFQNILNFRNGSFTEQIWQEPSQRSIQTPFDGLMMNAATQKDEQAWTDAGDGQKIRQALLIDNDAMSRMMLQRALLAEGIDCMSSRSMPEAQQMLKTFSTDLLILDASLPETDIQALFDWLPTYQPQCSVLLLGQPHWEITTLFRCEVLQRPISPKRLKEVLFEMTQVGFRGYLSRIGVLDFLQLNISAIDERKKLHIRDLSNGVDGQIFVNRGRFIHAEFGDLKGEEAFYRIAAIEQGDFFEDPAFAPPAETLADVMPHKLMINAGRFAKPLHEPEAPAAPTSDAAGMAEAAGMTSLFGDDDDVQLNLGGRVTSLFGDDDDVQLNLGGGGGSSSLFGADSGSLSQGSAAGVTSLFADDEIELKLGADPPPGPPAEPSDTAGVSSLFSEDELDDLQFSLGD